MTPINILLTADSGYLLPIRTMLHSLFVNNRAERFHIYMMHADMPHSTLESLSALCSTYGGAFMPVRVPAGLFAKAPVRSYWTETMYYRLLAPYFLPEHMDRILYLDPDILILNTVREFFETDLGGNLFAAAAQRGIVNITGPVNAFRLGTSLSQAYFNSGVLLCDLTGLRRETSTGDVFACIEKHRRKLLLPDQDVLNILFGNKILPVDEILYNYDARRYESYYLVSGGTVDMEWVLHNTVIMHFCGRDKPWHENAKGRFAGLYKQYMEQTPLMPESFRDKTKEASALPGPALPEASLRQ